MGLELFAWGGYAGIKIMCISIVILYGDIITKNAVTFYKRIQHSITNRSRGYNVRLARFIIKHDGLPTKETTEYFGIDNKQYKQLGDHLEACGILVRGQNNARVLADHIQSFDDIEKLLHSPIKKVSDSYYQYLGN